MGSKQGNRYYENMYREHVLSGEQDMFEAMVEEEDKLRQDTCDCCGMVEPVFEVQVSKTKVMSVCNDCMTLFLLEKNAKHQHITKRN